MLEKLWQQKYFQKQSSRGVLKKGVLRNFAKFTGKHLYQSLFFNKVTGLNPASLLKKRLWHRYFPVSFAKFLRTPFFTEHPPWLLLLVTEILLLIFDRLLKMSLLFQADRRVTHQAYNKNRELSILSMGTTIFFQYVTKNFISVVCRIYFNNVLQKGPSNISNTRKISCSYMID